MEKDILDDLLKGIYEITAFDPFKIKEVLDILNPTSREIKLEKELLTDRRKFDRNYQNQYKLKQSFSQEDFLDLIFQEALVKNRDGTYELNPNSEGVRNLLNNYRDKL